MGAVRQREVGRLLDITVPIQTPIKTPMGLPLDCDGTAVMTAMKTPMGDGIAIQTCRGHYDSGSILARPSTKPPSSALNFESIKKKAPMWVVELVSPEGIGIIWGVLVFIFNFDVFWHLATQEPISQKILPVCSILT